MENMRCVIKFPGETTHIYSPQLESTTEQKYRYHPKFYWGYLTGTEMAQTAVSPKFTLAWSIPSSLQAAHQVSEVHSSTSVALTFHQAVQLVSASLMQLFWSQESSATSLLRGILSFYCLLWHGGAWWIWSVSGTCYFFLSKDVLMDCPMDCFALW